MNLVNEIKSTVDERDGMSLDWMIFNLKWMRFRRKSVNFTMEWIRYSQELRSFYLVCPAFVSYDIVDVGRRGKKSFILFLAFIQSRPSHLNLNDLKLFKLEWM